ncbi:MAG: (Fe-S)-binding protein [Bacteroidales bacterium]|nr:(Fe-S)-binding protein [Bacteroidales bacterium]
MDLHAMHFPYHPFVLPFTIGLVFVFFYVIGKWIYWISRLGKDDRIKIFKNIFTLKTPQAVYEVFMECLIHRKVFKKNALLGYMHMSLALGWFLLIVLGNLETRYFTHGRINPPYFPIFFEFFEHDLISLNYGRFWTFTMDLLLLFILTGVGLAYFKRFKSKPLGMQKTTKHVPIDRLALTALWLIFPLRLFAEGVTAGLYDAGSFLTNPIGNLFASTLPIHYLYYPSWWAYSFALGTFFVLLPFTRYMHIPTEILLIFLRKYGIAEKDIHSTYTKVELSSCSRCGICIDACQLGSDLGIVSTQSTYFIKSLRYDKPSDLLIDSCMVCKRCDQVCPVGIDIASIRANERKELHLFDENSYKYINGYRYKSAKVAYFTGCMGHLTPSVYKATLALFDKAGVDYNFIDKDGSICCGRPLQLSGQEDAAKQLIEKNIKLIENCGATILVTSCPICAKIFNDNYNLKIPIYHHSQYLLKLAKEKKLTFNKTDIKITYHDPCELGRGLGVYDEPRELLKLAGNLIESSNSRENSLCCGGSLGITNISQEQRHTIASITLDELSANKADIVATACPLCKKTFKSASENIMIADISEIMLDSISDKSIKHNLKIENKEVIVKSSK